MGETTVVAVWQEEYETERGGARLREINIERGLKRRFLRAEKNGRRGRSE